MLATQLVEELGSKKCYFPGPIDVTSEVGYIFLLLQIAAVFNQVRKKKSQVKKGIQDTQAYFSAPLVGAILSSGIVSSPMKGYGPNNTLTSYSQFEHVVKVNLLGTFCVAQKVSEVLLKNEPMGEDKERGIIITVSSILGLDGLLVGYGTSKAGIIGLTLPLAKELSPFGIRVMSIAPGPFGKKKKVISSSRDINSKFAVLVETPLVNRSSSAPKCLFPERYGKPQEFADLVLQVIQMTMLNGSVIRLDGALRA